VPRHRQRTSRRRFNLAMVWSGAALAPGGAEARDVSTHSLGTGSDRGEGPAGGRETSAAGRGRRSGGETTFRARMPRCIPCRMLCRAASSGG